MRYYISIYIVLTCCQQSFAQNNDSVQRVTLTRSWFILPYGVLPTHITRDTSMHFYTDTIGIRTMYPSYIFLGIKREACKQLLFVYQDTSKPVWVPLAAQRIIEPAIVQPKKIPFLQVHGNVYYDVFYQSNIDTPYFERDIYQHTLRTYLDVTVKNQYPLRVSFTTRFSNSNMFRDFTGLNFQFNTQKFRDEVQERIKQWSIRELQKTAILDSLKNKLEEKANALNRLRNQLLSLSYKQKLVEAKENALVKLKQGIVSDSAPPVISKSLPAANNSSYQLPDKETAYSLSGRKMPGNLDWLTVLQKRSDTTKSDVNPNADTTRQKVDSTIEKLQDTYAKKQKEADSLQRELSLLETFYKNEKQSYSSHLRTIQQLGKTTDPKALLTQLRVSDIPDSVMPTKYKTLLAVKSFGIGRSMINYSELTAKNVNITGVQLEYNPHRYFAVATGVVDYVFRDFIVDDPYRQKQYLSVIRYGTGDKNGNGVILSYYFGKKQLYDYSRSDSSQVAYAPNYHLMGFSIEGKYRLNRNTNVIAEVAKSSLPYFNRVQNKQSLVASAFSFKDHTNEAYSVKLYSYIPRSRTRLSGFYKYYGANFQSYSLFTSGSRQIAWMIKMDQPFFKNKLTVSTSLKTYDYNSPYLVGYSSNTIFKSVQATMHIRKWPTVSLGYFPSTQLIKLSEQQYTENLFYTMVGTMNHFYTYRTVTMNSALTYTQFYNRQSDSGFVYFNTKNISLQQSVLLPKVTLQATVNAASNDIYNLYGIEAGIQLKIINAFSFGGSVKYNRQTYFNIDQVGYGINSSIKLKQLGELQLLWIKGFIPGSNRQLVQNDVGRLTFYKIF